MRSSIGKLYGERRSFHLSVTSSFIGCVFEFLNRICVFLQFCFSETIPFCEILNYFILFYILSFFSDILY